MFAWISGLVRPVMKETCQRHLLKDRIGPDIFAMGHVGVEDAALAVRFGPGGGVGAL